MRTPPRLRAATALACAIVGTTVVLSLGVRPARAGERIVSLAPSITETLFAIGAGDQLVGVSDWCVVPDTAAALPRTGSSLAPRYEAIARLRPTVIVSERIVHGQQNDLERIAPTRLLPWLALDDIIAGTRELGVLTGHVAASDALADRFAALRVAPAADAPRVLLVLGDARDSLDDVVFIRRNSLHGTALAAAGGRNAVDEDVSGVPRLGLERLLRVDPDVVIVLTLLRDTEAALRPWRSLTALRAVREGRLVALSMTARTNGPSVLDLKDRLTTALAGMRAAP